MNYLKLFFATIALTSSSYAALNPGDLALIGYQTDGTTTNGIQDTLSIVTLTEIPVDEEIYFTDASWQGFGPGSFRDSEHANHIKWKNDTGKILSRGTVITYYHDDDEFNLGSKIAGDRVSYVSNAGDQWFAYQGSKTNPTFIMGAQFARSSGGVILAPTASNSSATTNIPNSLLSHFQDLGGSDNGYYSGSTGVFSNAPDSLVAITNTSNWTFDTNIPAGNAYDLNYISELNIDWNFDGMLDYWPKGNTANPNAISAPFGPRRKYHAPTGNQGYLAETYGAATVVYQEPDGFITYEYHYETGSDKWKKYDFHRGVDIFINRDTEKIYAAESGVVQAVNEFSNGTHYISIYHGENLDGKKVYTFYIHINKELAEVESGDIVTAGQHIVTGWNDGDGNWPHVHFEVRIGGTSERHSENPVKYLPNMEKNGVPEIDLVVAKNSSEGTMLQVKTSVKSQEVDLAGLRVTVKNMGGTLLAAYNLDHAEWNSTYFGSLMDDPTLNHDNNIDPLFSETLAIPTFFGSSYWNNDTRKYELFHSLWVDSTPDIYQVTLEAYDTHGNGKGVIKTVTINTKYDLNKDGFIDTFIEHSDPNAKLTVMQFQNGLNGYNSFEDTFISVDASTQNNSNASTIRVGSGSNEAHGLIRFNDIVGNGLNQIPLGTEIHEAKLIVGMPDDGTDVEVYRMTSDFDLSTATWNSIGGNGVTPGVDCESNPVAQTDYLNQETIEFEIDITDAVKSWVENGEENYGLAIIASSNFDNDDVEFNSSQNSEQLPPRLKIILKETSNWTSQDVGEVGIVGSTTESNGTFTVEGGGTDIYGTTDEFHFVSQPAGSQSTMTARVNSVQNTNAWAKAGVMFRDGLEAGAKEIAIIVRPNQQVSMQWRTKTGNSTGYTNPNTSASPGIKWVKLERDGNNFSAYYSTDGLIWTFVATKTISMSNNVRAGLAVTSHNNANLCTAVFDNVELLWEELNFDDFEDSTFGSYNDGDGSGNLCSLIDTPTHSEFDNKCLLIRQFGENAEFNLKDAIEVNNEGYSAIKLDFSFILKSCENSTNDGFVLQYKVGSSSWQDLQEYKRQNGYSNDTTYTKSFITSDSQHDFSSDMKFRFLMEGNNNSDRALIDNISISAR